MTKVDIAIVGGGMAGSTAAAMLRRAGYHVALVDPHTVYPEDFRCEKLDNSQVALLEQTGLADELLSVANHADCIWIYRHGRLIEKRPSNQRAARYDILVNRMRELAGDVLVDKVASIATSPDRQTLTLAKSGEISARLVIVANGLNRSLRESLGLVQQVISEDHSISLGFDIRRADGEAFPFRALTYFPETLDDRIAYLSMFPFGEGVTRANLFVYRDMKDPWLRQLRKTPVEALKRALPGLSNAIGDFEISSPVQIRPATLYVTTNREQDGIVLVGDAGGTSCPSAGTGLNKVFTDVERLCGTYVPSWLATDGMTAEKIAAFYADRIKTECDAESLSRAFLAKRVATDSGLRWRARRTIRYAGQRALGLWRAVRTNRPDADAIPSLRRT